MIKLFRFLKPYKKQVAAMLVLLLLKVLGTLYIPTLTAEIVNKGIIGADLNYIWRISGVMLLAAAIVVGVSILETYLSSHNAALIGRDIRNALFRKIQDLSFNDFNRFGTASMINRNTNDVIQIQQAFSTVVEMLLPAPFMTIAGLILAFSKDRILAFSIVGVMIIVILLALLLSKKAVPMFSKLQVLLDNMNRSVREKIIGVRVIRAFSRTGYEKKRMDETFTDYGKLGIRINKLFAVLMPLIILIMNLCTLMIIWVGGLRISSGMMQLGDLIAIIEYATITLTYLIMGIAAIMVIPKANISAERINAVLDIESSLSKELTKQNENSSTTKVEFRNVTFGYNGADEPVLHDISFCTGKGQTTAIIGSTGSGKSTIANLLMQFYEPQEGDIFIDGEDIRNLSVQTIRSEIGYIPQKAFLFSGTIADNLLHGKKDATFEEMLHATKIAQIDGFIAGLDKGFDSPVSQGGTNFSGGQKQRLSIARAIIRNPKIFVFDDSFSALDFKTDAKLRAALKSETADAAVIIVAQRISTIMDADQIIVLDNGRIAGKGTHNELLHGCQVYQQIAESQLSKEGLA
ncbi:ABC transporter ATP-binding protein [Clostridium cellulovorans]|uniref:ABC transporter transmembrane region n=1 Tax=Clostridium cellulovorans (strain ATCC 35296 / DSM 3052 / OCM 3 / 743B) TaxID=573061 RepID=D9SU90_CLOC7|nr:ABC transporter ATP-binding protein [Clostridium cellulovorans]ADL52845.1 ABC transporter transmembrane region [Clostridium cellulovorans 743B]